MLLSLVRNVALRKPSKCRLIHESFSINAPVAAQSCVPKKGIVVSIAHIQINTARQSRRKKLELHKQSPRTPGEKESLAREIESTDRMIGGLVYELYGLSEDEVKIVEGKS